MRDVDSAQRRSGRRDLDLQRCTPLGNHAGRLAVRQRIEPRARKGEPLSPQAHYGKAGARHGPPGPAGTVGFVELCRGHRRRNGEAGRQTTLRAGPGLIALIEQHQVTTEDFGPRDDEEVIVLKERKGNLPWAKARNLEYQDTPETERMRRDMRRINQHSGRPTSVRAGRGRRRQLAAATGPALLRRLDQHGRMYNGFWIDLPRPDRLERLRIAGARSSSWTTAKWASGCGTPRPSTGASLHRRLRRTGLRGLPARLEAVAELDDRVAEAAAAVPAGRAPSCSRGACHSKGDRAADRLPRPYPAPLLSRPVPWLMFRESEIMVRVLLRLIDQDITALPIHDGLLVAEHNEEAARRAMLECFREATDFEGSVKVERSMEGDDNNGRRERGDEGTL